ncbi:MAG: hypothetical protein AAGA93_07630 [Actinomycetota bacterium]
MSIDASAGPAAADARPDDDPQAWSALAELYHRFLTGTLLALVVRAGTEPAAEVVFRTFRRQHLDAFLPGLDKLGLTDQPHAVACAKYHVLSNALGGVRVEWIPESDTKSWVRYRPPRWIFDGTAVCGIPTELSRAMLRGWHGHNGATLGNDNLGFVCTKQTTDGQPGLEGYYIEEPEPLPEDEKVRYRPGEEPPGPSVDLPLPSWDPVRLAKVDRNYAATYIRTLLPAMGEVLGPATAGAIGRIAGRQIGMQYHQTVLELLGDEVPDLRSAPDPEAFARRLARLLAGHGATVDAGPSRPGWTVDWVPRMFTGAQAPSAFEAWNGLWEGMAEMEGLRLQVEGRHDEGDLVDAWRITVPR